MDLALGMVKAPRTCPAITSCINGLITVICANPVQLACDQIKDGGAYGLIVVQGEGLANKLRLNCPKLLRFNELSQDEFFATEAAARAGVTFENTSETEPLVCLRYFGPDAQPDAPAMGAHRTP